MPYAAETKLWGRITLPNKPLCPAGGGDNIMLQFLGLQHSSHD